MVEDETTCRSQGLCYRDGESSNRKVQGWALMSIPCKSCGKSISFVQTPKGRHMPVDGDEPETFYLDMTVRGPDRVVTHDGEVLTGRIVGASSDAVTTVKGYVPHWDTCPHAEKFRQGN